MIRSRGELRQDPPASVGMLRQQFRTVFCWKDSAMCLPPCHTQNVAAHRRGHAARNLGSEM